MSNKQNLTKEQLIKLIEQIEKNPSDKVGILADVGVTALGAAGAGAVAALLGTTTASIPIITAVTGIGMVVAAPAVLVAGAAVAGGAAIYGASRWIKDGGFHEGKRKQLLNEYRENLKEIEAKERQADLNENDKIRFYSFLKEPLKHNLIDPDDAQQLMQAVENGYISLSDAYKLIGQILSEENVHISFSEACKPTKKILPSRKTQQSRKVVTTCPNCPQKLRAPSDLGQLNLTCPKCKHSWLWVPK